MADEKRSVWGKPKLIAVARNRPEEFVLEGCKTEVAGGGFESLNFSCAYDVSCVNCDSLAAT